MEGGKVERTKTRTTSAREVTMMVGRYDMALLVAVLVLASIGSLLVFSTTINPGLDISDAERTSFLRHHLVSIGLGAIAFMFVRYISPETLSKLATVTILIGIPLILAMKFIPGFASDKGGSKRWLELLGMSFQPTEVIKACWAIYLAMFLHKHATDLNDWKRALGFLLFLCGAVAGPIAILPDVGTAVIIGTIMLVMLFVTGLNAKNALMFFGTFTVAGVVIFFIDRVKVFRIVGWLFPDETRRGIGFHLDQAVTTIGTGGMFGKGIGHGSFHILKNLPESNTDFIFAVGAEELGFVGIICICVLYAVIAVRGYMIARRSEDIFRRNLAFSITVLLVMPAVLHLCVNVGLMPTKGLVCPFMSYGGTAMIVSIACVGILQRIHIDATGEKVVAEEFLKSFEKTEQSGSETGGNA